MSRPEMEQEGEVTGFGGKGKEIDPDTTVWLEIRKGEGGRKAQWLPGSPPSPHSFREVDSVVIVPAGPPIDPTFLAKSSSISTSFACLLAVRPPYTAILFHAARGSFLIYNFMRLLAPHSPMAPYGSCPPILLPLSPRDTPL